MASLIGKEIGKYRITERIGRGGMADVYLGIHTHLERKVAIKVLHSHLLEGGDFIERFKREAKAVANLHHPNIVQVYDFDIQDDVIIMVMEYVEGTNLQQRLVELSKQGKRLPIKQIGSIINNIAGALDYAHSQGMLHRDVKPSNILLDKDGKAYLTDFGIAKIIGDQKFTATGTLMGTPTYMSPEQGRGEELAEESDIYSLGIVAFEMLTGRVPFDAKTPIGIVQKQISEPVPDISQFVNGIPTTTQEVIEKALAKSPKGRFATAEALVDALKLALRALESSEAVPPTPGSVAAPSVEEAYSTPTVAMENTSETDAFERSTVAMQESKKPPAQEKASLPARKSPIPPAAGQTPKRKIPRWGFAVIGVVVVAAAAMTLVQIIGPGAIGMGGEPTPSPTLRLSIRPTSIVTTRAASPTPKPIITNGEGVLAMIDAAHMSNGLTITAGYDFDTEQVAAGKDQETAWRTGNGRTLPSVDDNQMEDQYMVFEIDDQYFFDIPRGSRIRLEIEYLDDGTDWFQLQYDAQSGGPYNNGSFVDADIMQKSGSGDFKTAVYILEDARFANGQNGSDFRINDCADGAETIRRVTISLES